MKEGIPNHDNSSVRSRIIVSKYSISVHCACYQGNKCKLPYITLLHSYEYILDNFESVFLYFFKLFFIFSRFLGENRLIISYCMGFMFQIMTMNRVSNQKFFFEKLYLFIYFCLLFRDFSTNFRKIPLLNDKEGNSKKPSLAVQIIHYGIYESKIWDL